jgi:mannobiose 2-epimerase
MLWRAKPPEDPRTLSREAAAKKGKSLAPIAKSYLKLADEMEAALHQHVLGVWFPRCVDEENGGFWSEFTRGWKRTNSAGKFMVFQGRMTWIAAQVAERRPELREQFLAVARHGVKFLDRVMWDKKHGGFFWGLDDRGQITPAYGDGKHLYANAFGIYALAAAYRATGDAKAIELARRGFDWVEEHAVDAKNGGYFEWFSRQGEARHMPQADDEEHYVPGSNLPIGFKSMNAHIHLLEAYTQLYAVWKDAAVGRRLGELLDITLDRICVEPGAMHLYFTEDWRPVPDHDSYGHDVETAFLVLEAAEALGREHEPKLHRMARMLVDHALTYGWDGAYGGFFNEGTALGRPEHLEKIWWVQVEGLNALLLMHDLHGNQTDRYWKAFQRQWEFIRDCQIDQQCGGLYNTVERDGTVTDDGKSEIWKAAYHDGRALLNVTERLRKLAGA